MNRDDVIDVLSVVAAATRRTVGEVDVDVWQAVIGELPVMGMVRGERVNMPLKAVRDHLAEQPGVWLEPGHVHQRVRAMIRDHLERESDEMRDRRRAAIDARIAESVDELAARKALPAARPRELKPNPLTVRCPWCKVDARYRCVIPRTAITMREYHPSRIEAAERAFEAEAARS